MKTKQRLHGPYRHGRRWRVQVRIGSRQQRYKSFASYSEATDFMGINVERMQFESESLLRRARTSVSSRDGWVYALSVAPDVNPKRIKVGFTTDIEKRFLQHKTTNPTAILLAAWEATADEERAAHRAIKGRIGVSEVFTVPNLSDAIDGLSKLLGPRLVPAGAVGGPVGSKPALVRNGFATAKQRAPKPNAKMAIADLVIRDVRARQEIGQRRYGVDLQANNGRDALVDAYQEAIDLAMYLRQLLEERKP